MIKKLILIGSVVCASPVFQQHAIIHEPDSSKQDLSLRELEIGEVNFIHTTDTHGWLGSHLTQPDYDANWGDFVSFTKRLKETRIGSNDLLIIDTGDKHDGNGLSDATTPNGVESTKIFNEQDYDLLTLGNHELYTEDNTIMEYYSTAKSNKFKDKYISSNVEFVTDGGKLVPFGNKYKYFRTENKGYRILTFSFLFNFQRSNSRAKVTPAIEEIGKPWFIETVATYPEADVDIILVFGHLPITDDDFHEINHLHSHLRSIYPNTVIQYFGGHSHIRDFAVFDDKSTGLQSGRFCETVGFLSIDGVTDDSPKFSRRYIDFNMRSFMHHTGVSKAPDFHTKKGLEISDAIEVLRDTLNLTEVVGYIPQSYYMYSKPIDSHKNIYNFLTSKVLPRLRSDATDDSKTRFIMINTGSIRYDLHKGEFTKDTEYIVSPFPNDWNYIEIPLSLATEVETYLNNGDVIMKNMAPPGFTQNFMDIRANRCPFIRDPSLTKGYTTLDDFGCDGDDTPHNTELYYAVPNVVQSVEVKPNGGEIVHFVFYSFIQPSILDALNNLNKREKVVDHYFTNSDCKLYGGKATKELLKDYIRDITK